SVVENLRIRGMAIHGQHKVSPGLAQTPRTHCDISETSFALWVIRVLFGDCLQLSFRFRLLVGIRREEFGKSKVSLMLGWKSDGRPRRRRPRLNIKSRNGYLLLGRVRHKIGLNLFERSGIRGLQSGNRIGISG